MLLFAETSTTISTIASYAASLPEQLELMVFGAVLATVAFLLRTTPAAAGGKNEKEAADKA